MYEKYVVNELNRQGLANTGSKSSDAAGRHQPFERGGLGSPNKPSNELFKYC
jgi:hypothetical protein